MFANVLLIERSPASFSFQHGTPYGKKQISLKSFVFKYFELYLGSKDNFGIHDFAVVYPKSCSKDHEIMRELPEPARQKANFCKGLLLGHLFR